MTDKSLSLTNRFSFLSGRWAVPLLCLAAGCIAALSMAPLNAWPALFLGLSTLYVCLSRAQTEEKPVRRGFLYGWLFGFGYFLCSLSWVGNALLVDGNPYRWAWPLAVCGLPFILAPFTGLACALACRAALLKTLPGYILFCIILGIAEWLRGHMFTGFPWNVYGYTWTDVLPIVQVVALESIYTLTLLTIFWSGAPGFLYIWPAQHRQKVTVFISIGLTFAGCFAFGLWHIKTYTAGDHNDVQIRIAHPFIPQQDKWDPQQTEPVYTRYLAASAPGDINAADMTTLIVWPETALHPAAKRDPGAQRLLRDTLGAYKGQAYLIAGTLRTDPDHQARHYNAAITYNKTGTRISTYDKHHLVPFGEYIPFQSLIPLKPINRFSGFVPGAGPETHSIGKTAGGTLSFSPLICYESIFPYESAPNSPDQRPDMLINITNDAWYEGSAGPYQHLVHARFRAVESGIPLIRAANGGLSALVDPVGRYRYKAYNLQSVAPPLVLPRTQKSGPDPAARKALFWGFCLITGLFALYFVRRRKTAK